LFSSFAGYVNRHRRGLHGIWHRHSYVSHHAEAICRTPVANYAARLYDLQINTQRKSSVPSILSTIIFFAGMFAYLAIRTVFKRGLASRPKSVSKVTLADMSLVVFVGLSQVGIPLLAIVSPAFSWANYQLPAFLLWPGTALIVAGVWLFWRSHADLGKNWSVSLELAQDHQLVTQGVYSTIRHPMYASFFLMALAQAALLPNWFSGWSALVSVSVLYLVRKPHEEAMMLSHFGQEYEAYMLKSGGIVPHLYRKCDS
jgi:protein-S-isoprenylcysteine O-methyltransferase Ste14